MSLRSPRRAIERLVGCCVLAGAATLTGCLTRPAQTGPLTPPSGLAIRRVAFPSRSGATIRGWYVRGAAGAGAVLLLHGVGSNRSSMVDRARFLHAAGYTVLLPDFQAHGESDGTRITFGLLESLDASAALEFLRSCTPGERVAVIGVSMGGAATLLGPGPLKVDALVLESVYPTIRQAVDDRLVVWLGPVRRLRRWVTPAVMREMRVEIGASEDSLRPIDRIGKVDEPVFVIAGTRDAYTTIAEARSLFDHASSPKEFWGVEGAKHEDLHTFARTEYEQRVGSFLAKYLRGVRAGSDTLAFTADRCSGAPA